MKHHWPSGGLHPYEFNQPGSAISHDGDRERQQVELTGSLHLEKQPPGAGLGEVDLKRQGRTIELTALRDQARVHVLVGSVADMQGRQMGERVEVPLQLGDRLPPELMVNVSLLATPARMDPVMEAVSPSTVALLLTAGSGAGE